MTPKPDKGTTKSKGWRKDKWREGKEEEGCGEGRGEEEKKKEDGEEGTKGGDGEKEAGWWFIYLMKISGKH